MFDNVDSDTKSLTFLMVAIMGGIPLCGAVAYFIVRAAQYYF